MREKMLNIATVLAIICAVGTTAFTVWGSKLQTRTAASAQVVPRLQRDWQRYASNGHQMGPSNARVTIVEFADFECPFCGEFKPMLDTILARHPSDVRVVFRHYPLHIHPLAVPAARASECAAEQGRFVPMYSALYQYQDSLGLVPWAWFAKVAGVPQQTAFEACTRRSGTVKALAQDTTAGRELGIHGTPTLLINSLRLDGVPTLDSLEAYIRAAESERGASR